MSLHQTTVYLNNTLVSLDEIYKNTSTLSFTNRGMFICFKDETNFKQLKKHTLVNFEHDVGYYEKR